MTSLQTCQAIYNNSVVPRTHPAHMRRSLVYVTSPNLWASFRNMKQLIKIPEVYLLQKREQEYILYSRKLSREKTFTNFTALWLFAKVFTIKFGAIASFGTAKASNMQKFSPRKSYFLRKTRYTVLQSYCPK